MKATVYFGLNGCSFPYFCVWGPPPNLQAASEESSLNQSKWNWIELMKNKTATKWTSLCFVTCYFKSQEYTQSWGFSAQCPNSWAWVSLLNVQKSQHEDWVSEREVHLNENWSAEEGHEMCLKVSGITDIGPFFFLSFLSKLLSNNNSKVLTEIITHMSVVTKQIKRGFHSWEVSVMQPLVIREPICQLMHLNLKLHVGNHPFYWSVFVWHIKVHLAPGRLHSHWPLTSVELIKYLPCGLYIICHCFHVLESVCKKKKGGGGNQCVGRQIGRDRDGVNEQLWQYFQYLLSSTECSCSGLWGAIKHPEMVGRFSL